MNTHPKTIVIVGASGDIGEALARRLHERGAQVVLAARSADKLESLRAELGERALAVPTDASSFNDMERLFETARAAFGSVDCVVISVGTWGKQITVDSPIEEVEKHLELHYQGMYRPGFVASFMAQRFFRQEGHGLIANISSHAATRSDLEGNLTYSPMKAAAYALTLKLRSEFKRVGAPAAVQATDIQPAIVNTAKNADALGSDERKRAAVQPKDIADWLWEHLDDEQTPPCVEFKSSVEL